MNKKQIAKENERQLPDYNAKIKYLKKKCNFLNTKCTRFEEKVKKVSKYNEKLKKQLYRSKKYSSQKILELELVIQKLKAREEILESSLKKTYKNCEKRAEKTILRNVIHNAKKNKTYIAKLLGLQSGKARKILKRNKMNNIAEIDAFYQRDDVSHCTSGKKECRTKNKNKQQIRYLLDTQQNLYTKYKDEGGKYKFATFCKHRPFYVISPHLASRNTCLCVKHNNFE